MLVKPKPGKITQGICRGSHILRYLLLSEIIHILCTQAIFPLVLFGDAFYLPHQKAHECGSVKVITDL